MIVEVDIEDIADDNEEDDDDDGDVASGSPIKLSENLSNTVTSFRSLTCDKVCSSRYSAASSSPQTTFVKKESNSDLS